MSQEQGAQSPNGFEALMRRSSPWLSGEGPHAEMVLSTRIRLARNLHSVPFTHRARDEQKEIRREQRPLEEFARVGSRD